MAYTATKLQTGRPRDLRSISGMDKELSLLHTFTSALALTQPPTQSAGVGAVFSGVKRTGRETYHLSLYVRSNSVHGDNLILPCN